MTGLYTLRFSTAMMACTGLLFALGGCQTVQSGLDELSALAASGPQLELSPDDVCVDERRDLVATSDFFSRNRDSFGQAGQDFLTFLALDFIGLEHTTMAREAQGRLAAQFEEAITSLVSNLQEDTAQIRDTQMAFDALVDCRKAEAAQIRSEYARGRIGFETAQARMADVGRKFEEELAYARSINEQFEERAESFQVSRRQARSAALEEGAAEQAVDSADAEADQALATNQRARAASEQQVAAAEALQNDPNEGFVLG